MDVNCYNYINLSYMEMMADGDDSMKKIMLEMLLDELPQEIDKLDENCQQANWKEVGEVSHKLKSTLAFVGNDKLTALNKNIETLARDGEVTEISSLIEGLKELYPSTIVELKQEVEKL